MVRERRNKDVTDISFHSPFLLIHYLHETLLVLGILCILATFFVLQPCTVQFLHYSSQPSSTTVPRSNSRDIFLLSNLENIVKLITDQI